MQLFQLEVFCRVVDCRSFSAAASQLHVTQPAVSHHVHAAGRGAELVLRVDDHDRVLHGVLAGTADVGVVWSPVRTSRLCAEPLGRERFVLVAAGDWPGAGAITPERLRNAPFVLGRPGSFMRRCVEGWLSRAGVEAKASMEAISVADMKLAV